MEKTAVKWLVNELKESIGLKDAQVIEQAKEMEKQQIMKSRQDIFHTGNLTNEQYYNETFKSE